MSFSLITHRPTESSSESVSLPVIPWSQEYDWAGNSSPTETKLNSLDTGRAYPSEVTFQSNLLQNVYANTALANSPQKLPNKTGTKIYANVSETWSKTSSDDASYEALLPASVGITIKVPNDPLVTPTVVWNLLLRAVGTLVADGTGVLPEDWLARLLVGSTNPILTINT